MSFHFCYFAHFCSFLCILTNPAPEIPLLLFINIRQFPCFETMGRFSVSLFLILFCVFTAAVLENTSDRHRCSVACVRNLDTGCFRAGMDDLSVTDINRNMSGIANQITGLRVCQTSYVITDITVGSGGMRQGYAEILINAHNKTGAVRTVCQTCPTVYIGITDKLYRIVCNGLSQAGTRR